MLRNDMLDKQVKGVRQPYTYREWLHDACETEYGDRDYYTDDDLDSMSDEQLTWLEKELECCGEGASAEYDGTH